MLWWESISEILFLVLSCAACTSITSFKARSTQVLSLVMHRQLYTIYSCSGVLTSWFALTGTCSIYGLSLLSNGRMTHVWNKCLFSLWPQLTYPLYQEPSTVINIDVFFGWGFKPADESLLFTEVVHLVGVVDQTFLSLITLSKINSGASYMYK